MKKLLAILAAVVAVAAIGVTAAVSSGDGRTVLKFDTMPYRRIGEAGGSKLFGVELDDLARAGGYLQ